MTEVSEKNRLNRIVWFLGAALYILVYTVLMCRLTGTEAMKYGMTVLSLAAGAGFWVLAYGHDWKQAVIDNKAAGLLYVVLIGFDTFFGWEVLRGHTAGEPFVYMASFLQSLLSLLPFFIYFAVFQWKWQIKNIFLLANMILGIGMMLVIPVGAVPDEPAHLNAAYRMSNKMMHVSDEAGSYYVMRQDDAEVGKNGYWMAYYQDGQTFDQYLSYFAKSLVNDEMIPYGLDNLLGSGYLYIVPGAGISIGRILHLNTAVTLLLGRLFNFLLYTLLTYMAFSLIPCGSGLLLSICLLPMNLHQAMSYSYDSPLLGLSFLAAALSLKIIYQERDSWRDWTGALIIFALIWGIKTHAYFLVGAMPAFMLIRKRLNAVLSRKAKRIIWIVILGLIVLLIGGYCWWYKSGRAAALPYTPNMIDLNGTQDPFEAYSVPYLLKNPKCIPQIIGDTLSNMSLYYIETMFGRYLGWLNLEVPLGLIGLLAAGLIFAALPGENEQVKKINGYWLVFGLVFLFTFLFIFAGLMIGWTSINQTIIQGIQGRYFLPILFIVMMYLKKLPFHISEKADRVFILTYVILSLTVVEYLLIRL